jgi:hypothetical protein
MCCINSLNHFIIHSHPRWNTRCPILGQNPLINVLQIISNYCWYIVKHNATHLQSTVPLEDIQHYYSLFSTVIYDCTDGDRDGIVVRVLCYISEGRWFDSKCCHWNWHNPSDRNMDLGSTQSLTEMITRRISWG